MNSINIDGEYKLLEQVSSDGRTLLCWINLKNDVISIFLFNQFSKPNKFSQRSDLSQWGWPTYFVTNITTKVEASQVVSLYVQDMGNQNYWWERDTNAPIPPTPA